MAQTAAQVLKSTVMAFPDGELKNVLLQVSDMFGTGQTSFDTHVADNVAEGEITREALTRLADRVTAMEARLDQIGEHGKQTVAEVASLKIAVDDVRAVFDRSDLRAGVMQADLDVMKNKVSDIEDRLISTPEIEELKEVHNRMKTSGASDHRRQPLSESKGIQAAGKFPGKRDVFEPWSKTLRSNIIQLVPEAKQWLTWAKMKGASTIADSDVQSEPGMGAAAVKFSGELHTVLMNTTEGTAKSLITNCGESGLECWRKLNYFFDPETPHAQIVSINDVMRPNKAKGYADIMSVVEKWEADCGKLRGEARTFFAGPLKRAALVSICFKELEDHFRINADKYETYEQVRNEIERLVVDRLGDSRGSTPMELGAVGQAPQDPWSRGPDPWSGSAAAPPPGLGVPANKGSDPMASLAAAINNMNNNMANNMRQLGALIQGGANRPFQGSFQGGGKGGGSKGGRVWTGKGPMPSSLTCFKCGGRGHLARNCTSNGPGKGPASEQSKPLQVCRNYSKLGRCPWEEKHGKGTCKFRHVDNMPQALHGVDGMPIDVLGPLTWSDDREAWSCDPAVVDVQAILGNCDVPPERAAATLENMNVTMSSDGWEVIGGDRSGFPGLP